MRITCKISGAGNNGLTRLPFLDVDIDKELTDGNGRLDESKCRQLLAQPDNGIQMSSKDCIPVFAFAIELLKHVRLACENMIANRRTGNVTDAHTKACCADDRHAERNMDKGRWLYVRADIGYSSVTNAVKLRIDIQNPKGIVGVAERIALDYALILARCANNIADQLAASHGSWSCEFSGGPGCPDLFTDARNIERALALNKKASECPNHQSNDYCSPVDFSCPCLKNGKCCWKEAL